MKLALFVVYMDSILRNKYKYLQINCNAIYYEYVLQYTKFYSFIFN